MIGVAVNLPDSSILAILAMIFNEALYIIERISQKNADFMRKFNLGISTNIVDSVAEMFQITFNSAMRGGAIAITIEEACNLLIGNSLLKGTVSVHID